ncbi:MAG: NAD(P)/FAD-dependent oxidoreductase [Myxococcota bacterium]|jgi:uncharacterized FAD-dependent dehydrogenase|nr:NAD(P)/FAD-dependent oxidoreductase [Myxococcota bacterium]
MANTRRGRVNQVVLDLDEDELESKVLAQLGLPRAALRRIEVLRRSWDARHRPRLLHNLEVEFDADAKLAHPEELRPCPSLKPWTYPKPQQRQRIAVLGAGPAGLFAAITLARGGQDVTLFDRGKLVAERSRDVASIFGQGRIDPNSNICFGFGGAGTWSDGKLSTRIDAPELRSVFEAFCELGAPRDILIDARAHLGTDRLFPLMSSFEALLRDEGVRIRPQSLVRRLLLEARELRGLELDNGEQEHFDRVILATGHSARELFASLVEQGVAVEKKAFAVGLRIEHPQSLIDQLQYGRYAGHPRLPVAEYRLSTQLKPLSRGVYSFCMCPGGCIVASSTLEDGIVVNGMSDSARSGPFANAAIVVTVDERDFSEYGLDALSGIAFQEALERRCHQAAERTQHAPAQSLLDFLHARPPKQPIRSSYRPGVSPFPLHQLLPPQLVEALRAGLQAFDRKMPGFITETATLHAIESRTSSPLRVLRGPTFESISHRHLYPCGEGAGYAGGISSSAVDGLRVARRILDELGGRA